MALTLASLLFLVTTQGQAEEQRVPEPPLRYQVQGIGAGETLDIRKQPDSTASIIGTLSADDTRIVVAGTQVESDDEVWWQIFTPEGPGWVNSRYLAPAEDGLVRDTTFPLRCAGTEPFWNTTIRKEQATFSTPEASTNWQAGQMKAAAGRQGRFIVSMQAKNKQGFLAAWRNPSFCTDGMSDIGFPYESILVAPDGNVYAGCCQRDG